MRFPSRFEYVKMAANILSKVSEMVGLGEEESIELVSSVVEALNNSIEHGYNLKEDGVIELKVENYGDKLLVSVRDEGQGFTREDLPSYCPDRSDHLFRYRGRGVFMMENFMDEVSFKNCPEQGMEVVMVKYLGNKGQVPGE